MTAPAATSWTPYASLARELTLPRGERLQYFEKGSGEPLVYLHGSGLQPGWNDVLERLSASRRVAAPLIAGFGESTGLEDIDDMLDVIVYLDEVFEALGLESADVVGFDLGGMFAAELAAVLHHRVRKLVLVAPFGLWLDESEPVDFFGLPLGELPGVFFADPGSPAAKAYFAQPEPQEELLEYTVQRTRALAASSKFLWPIPDRGLAKRLHRVRAETLVIWGAQDALMPPLYGERFAKVIPSARREPLEGGHMLHLEQPERLAELVRGFVR